MKDERGSVNERQSVFSSSFRAYRSSSLRTLCGETRVGENGVDLIEVTTLVLSYEKYPLIHVEFTERGMRKRVRRKVICGERVNRFE